MELSGMAENDEDIRLQVCPGRAAHSSRLTAILVLLLSITAHAQAPVWSNTWRVQAPTPFFTGTPPDFAFSADGELTFAQVGPSRLDYQYARIDVSGNARWSANLGVQFYTELGDAKPLLPYPDGSAIIGVDLGYVEFSRIARVGADGSVTWIRAIEADALVALPNQRVLAVSCASLVELDVATGNVAWQYGNPGAPAASCIRNRATSDAGGNIYAIAGESLPSNQFQLHATKLDPAGHVIWQNALAAGTANDAALVGESDGLLFVRTYSELRVLHAIDGTPAWSIPFSDTTSNAVVLAGNPAEAIVIDGATASRLANDTGAARWSTELQASVSSATIAGGAVVALQSGTVARIDAASGSISWQTPLPSTDADNNALIFSGAGLMGPGTLVVVAGRGSFFAAPPFLQKIDFSTGQPLGTIDAAPVAQGAMASSIAEDATHIIDAAVVADSASWTARVRRLDAATGAVLWESSEPLPNSGPPYFYGATQAFAPTIAFSGSEIAIAVSVGSALNVLAFERSSGALRWSKSFAEPYASAVNFTGPAIDADENVYIEDNLTYSCNPYLYCCPPLTTSCYALSLYKLAAADGSTLWKREGPPVAAPVLLFSLTGSDVILGGPFTGDLASSTLARLSGADGSSAIWSSSALPDYGVNGIFPLPDGSIEVTGNGFARLDAATGNTLWSKPYPSDPDCTQQTFCNVYDAVAAPNGDLYSVGESNHTLRVARLRGDGSGMADFWYPVQAVPGSRLVGTQIVRGLDGQLWLHLVRSSSLGPATLALIAAFDPEAGTISAQQVIGDYDNTDSLGPDSGAVMLSAPESGVLPVQILVSEPPLPATYGDALLNVGIAAHGDLSTSAILDPPLVMPGDTATFHVFVNYAGDAPVVGVNLIVALPWASGTTQLSCNVAGASNCVIDSRADALRASFDIEPGGSVEVTGSVMVIDIGSRTYPPAIHAVVYGAPGLAEPETVSNFTSAAIKQSIFFNGFD